MSIMGGCDSSVTSSATHSVITTTITRQKFVDKSTLSPPIDHTVESSRTAEFPAFKWDRYRIVMGLPNAFSPECSAWLSITG